MNIEDIEIKEDSQEKLDAVAGKPTKYFLMADEFNALVDGVKGSKYSATGQWEFTTFKAGGNNGVASIFGSFEGAQLYTDYLLLMRSSTGINSGCRISTIMGGGQKVPYYFYCQTKKYAATYGDTLSVGFMRSHSSNAQFSVDGNWNLRCINTRSNISTESISVPINQMNLTGFLIIVETTGVRYIAKNLETNVVYIDTVLNTNIPINGNKLHLMRYGLNASSPTGSNTFINGVNYLGYGTELPNFLKEWI